MSDDRALRMTLVEAARRMNALGINQGTSGNLSARVEDGFLITPTSLAYERMGPSDIVRMDFDGGCQGRRAPSSEWRVHRDILASRPEIGAVLHCHSLYATTLAVHYRDIPSFHYMVAVAGGTDIRCAGYATFGSEELSQNALRALDGRRACMLGQHGQIALGADVEEALWLAMEVETLSRLYVQALSLGEPPILTDEEMARVLKKMDAMRHAARGGAPA
jgi:L-fuculose-phosphate aldolase